MLESKPTTLNVVKSPKAQERTFLAQCKKDIKTTLSDQQCVFLQKPIGQGSYRLIGRVGEGDQQQRIVTKRLPTSDRFTYKVDDGFQGNPFWGMDIIQDPDVLRFFGFETIGNHTVLLPNAAKINASIKYFNTHIATDPRDQVGLKFYVPSVDLVPAELYLKKYISKGLLPLADGRDGNVDMKEVLHDIVFHLPGMFMPKRIHHHIRRRIGFLLSFADHLEELGLPRAEKEKEKLLEEFTTYVDNASGLPVLAYSPSLPNPYRLSESIFYTTTHVLTVDGLNNPLREYFDHWEYMYLHRAESDGYAKIKKELYDICIAYKNLFDLQTERMQALLSSKRLKTTRRSTILDRPVNNIERAIRDSMLRKFALIKQHMTGETLYGHYLETIEDIKKMFE